MAQPTNNFDTTSMAVFLQLRQRVGAATPETDPEQYSAQLLDEFLANSNFKTALLSQLESLGATKLIEEVNTHQPLVTNPSPMIDNVVPGLVEEMKAGTPSAMLTDLSQKFPQEAFYNMLPAERLRDVPRDVARLSSIKANIETLKEQLPDSDGSLAIDVERQKNLTQTSVLENRFDRLYDRMDTAQINAVVAYIETHDTTNNQVPKPVISEPEVIQPLQEQNQPEPEPEPEVVQKTPELPSRDEILAKHEALADQLDPDSTRFDFITTQLEQGQVTLDGTTPESIATLSGLHTSISDAETALQNYRINPASLNEERGLMITGAPHSPFIAELEDKITLAQNAYMEGYIGLDETQRQTAFTHLGGVTPEAVLDKPEIVEEESPPVQEEPARESPHPDTLTPVEQATPKSLVGRLSDEFSGTAHAATLDQSTISETKEISTLDVAKQTEIFWNAAAHIAAEDPNQYTYIQADPRYIENFDLYAQSHNLQGEEFDKLREEVVANHNAAKDALSSDQLQYGAIQTELYGNANNLYDLVASGKEDILGAKYLEPRDTIFTALETPEIDIETPNPVTDIAELQEVYIPLEREIPETTEKEVIDNDAQTVRLPSAISEEQQHANATSTTKPPYEVQSGDSLWRIAADQYGLTKANDIMRAIDHIAVANPELTDPRNGKTYNIAEGVNAHSVFPGQVLNMPSLEDVQKPVTPLDYEALDNQVGKGNNIVYNNDNPSNNLARVQPTDYNNQKVADGNSPETSQEGFNLASLDRLPGVNVTTTLNATPANVNSAFTTAALGELPGMQTPGMEPIADNDRVEIQHQHLGLA